MLAEARATLGRRAEQALRKRGAQASFVHTDVADFRSVQRLVRVVLERFGRIDCLVNNAGVLAVGSLVRVPVAALDRMLAINLRGPMLLTRSLERRGLIRPESVAHVILELAAGRRALFRFYRWASRVQRLQKEVPF